MLPPSFTYYVLLLIKVQYLIHSPVAWADTSMTFTFYPPNGLANSCDADPVGAEVSKSAGKTQLYDTTVNKTWSKMEELLGTGKVRAIGVGNFSVKLCVVSLHPVWVWFSPLYCKFDPAAEDRKSCTGSESGRVGCVLTLSVPTINYLSLHQDAPISCSTRPTRFL